MAGVDPQRPATGVADDGRGLEPSAEGGMHAADAAVSRGQRYYGQFDPPVDRFLHERYFADRSRPGVLIECGAFDGVTESSCKFFEESLGWTAYNLEASPRIFDALCRNRPHSHNLNLALSDRQGEAEFHDCSIPGFDLSTNGSLKHLDEHRAWLDSMQCRYRTSIVHTITFRDLVERLQVAHVDLMVLDVEGHELEALEGFTGAAVFPRVLCVEHGHLGVPAVRAAVERHGYVFDTTSHVNSFFVR